MDHVTDSEGEAFATRADLAKYESIKAWVDAHPEVTGYRILDDAVQEFPHDPHEDRFGEVTESPHGAAVDEFIACDYQRGITDVTVQARLRDWLGTP